MRIDRIVGILLLVLMILVGVSSLLLGVMLLIGVWVTSGPLLIKIKCSVFCTVLIAIGIWVFACLVSWSDRNML